MNQCPKCKTEDSEFYKGQYHCKTCQKAYIREWKRNNPDKQKKYNRDGWLKTTYGITSQEFDNLVEVQGGGCCVCGSTTTLVVDHQHTTGEVRGVLCDNCNKAAGLGGDSPSRLRALADYLEDRGHDGNT